MIALQGFLESLLGQHQQDQIIFAVLHILTQTMNGFLDLRELGLKNYKTVTAPGITF